jgi:hypothetical protein
VRVRRLDPPADEPAPVEANLTNPPAAPEFSGCRVRFVRRCQHTPPTRVQLSVHGLILTPRPAPTAGTRHGPVDRSRRSFLKTSAALAGAVPLAAGLSPTRSTAPADPPRGCCWPENRQPGCRSSSPAKASPAHEGDRRRAGDLPRQDHWRDVRGRDRGRLRGVVLGTLAEFPDPDWPGRWKSSNGFDGGRPTPSSPTRKRLRLIAATGQGVSHARSASSNTSGAAGSSGAGVGGGALARRRG